MPAAAPLIIEVAINGARSKDWNPSVPITPDEIVAAIDTCVAVGASIVHLHAGAPVVGSSGHHDSAAYLDVFARVRVRHPHLLMYPTLPGGAAGVTMADRLAHVADLVDAGHTPMVPVDPGTMNYGRIAADGAAPTHDAVYQTTFADVAWAYGFARGKALPCTMSLFEPGFVRLVEAHRRAGTLPARSIVKFEFSSGQRLFGPSPDVIGLDACLALLDTRALQWMVTLRDGDPSDGLAQLAIGRGGHVRVGLEDYGGSFKPSNAQLVTKIVEIARSLGRRPATPAEVPGLLATT